jgi:hypothetical protein
MMIYTQNKAAMRRLVVFMHLILSVGEFVHI